MAAKRKLEGRRVYVGSGALAAAMPLLLAVALSGCDRADAASKPGPAKLLLPEPVAAEATQLRLADRVTFDSNDGAVPARSAGLLAQLARVLKANPEVRTLRIEGYASDQAEASRRARSIRELLVHVGVEPSRLEAQGFGGESGRVEFVLVN